MSESWWVTIRGQTRQLITCQRTEARDEFLVFIDQDDKLLLLVRRDELIALERYVEPPF